jgi:hypothetical protein
MVENQNERQAGMTEKAKLGFTALREMFDEADRNNAFSSPEVYRWWTIRMWLEIYGALDSISYCLREQLAMQKARSPFMSEEDKKRLEKQWAERHAREGVELPPERSRGRANSVTGNKRRSS